MGYGRPHRRLSGRTARSPHHGNAASRAGAFSSLRRVWTNAPLWKRVLLALAALLVAVLLMAAIMGTVRLVQYWGELKEAQRRQAEYAEAYDFDPGNIITDENLFNSSAMTEQQVQNFLNDKGSACNGSQCLKQYAADTEDKPADSLCKAYQGGRQQSAAAIIDASARACGISQRVLLTMLQKEQHLVTATAPTAWQYEAAMGLSCPDTASCDPQYAGFLNQVYGAAHRLRSYMAHEANYPYRAKRLTAIRYHPRAACGSSQVYIENTATALLYIYTPYQPNEAALKAGSGEGDACSSYGNRNFALIYSGWFGDPAIDQ